MEGRGVTWATALMYAPDGARRPRRYPSHADRERVAEHLRALLPPTWSVEARETDGVLFVDHRPPGRDVPTHGGCVLTRIETGRGWQRREAVRLWALCVGLAGVAACERSDDGHET
jgi:hypothetical protein